MEPDSLSPHRRPTRHTLRIGRARRTVAVVALTVAFAAACAPPTEDGRTTAAVRGPRTTAPARSAPAGSYITAGERLGVGGCPLFPANNVFHADASTLEVTPDSDAVLAAAGAGLTVKPTFRSSVWQGSRGGIPVNVVDSRVTRPVGVIGGAYAYISDLNGHPIPNSPKVEGYPGMAWDRRMLLVDAATCTSHEFLYVSPPAAPITTSWSAEKAVKIDLRSNAASTRGSSIASGGSMLARMLRYDEVAAGRIDHVLGVSLPAISTRPPLWPAMSSDGRSSDPDAPRMGTWLRLRSDVDLSGLGPDARLVAEALQQHGAVLGDTGPPGAMSLIGENDDRWDDDDLDTLRRLKVSDFEVVDASPMKVADNSYEIR